MTYTRAELFVLPIALSAMVFFALLLRFLTRKKPLWVQDLPFLCIAVAVLALELVKQGKNIVDGYDTWTIPLHYCSTFAVWFPLAEFTRGNVRKRMQNIAFVASFCLLALFYFNPRSIIGGACENVFGDFGAFHTFFYHHLALLYCILGIIFKRFRPDFHDGWLWISCMSVYLSIAVIFAFGFQTNYFNILQSNVPFMEFIRVTFGQIAYLLFFFSLVLLGGASVFWIKARFDKTDKRKTVA
ncbi:MAG: YwaF family protein [Clostridia bacterium]|nr:YwaF family protein [Clostridia bacterium]